MDKALLDTDILSEYLKGHDRIVAGHAAAYAREHGVFTFTSVTVHEIVYGLEFKNAAAQRAKALAWLGRNEQITPTAADYLSAATIKAGARKQGSTATPKISRPFKRPGFRCASKTGVPARFHELCAGRR